MKRIEYVYGNIVLSRTPFRWGQETPGGVRPICPGSLNIVLVRRVQDTDTDTDDQDNECQQAT